MARTTTPKRFQNSVAETTINNRIAMRSASENEVGTVFRIARGGQGKLYSGAGVGSGE